MLYAYVQTNDLFTINEERQDSFIREQMNKHQVRTLLKTEGLPILRPCGAPQVRREGVSKMRQKDLGFTSSQGRTKITAL